MATSAVWTKARRVMFDTVNKGKEKKAGRLYEHMLAEGLDCEITPRGNAERADLHSNNLGLRIEVKSKGDVKIPELRVSQIREYEEPPPFPLHHSLYGIVLYHSTENLPAGAPRPRGIGPNTHRISLMRDLKTDAEYNSFFASHVQTVYLLDLRIIQALEKKLGSHPCRHIGRSDEMAVRLRRQTLDKHFGDVPFAESLRQLGLHPPGWVKGVYPMHVRFQIDKQRLTSRFTMVTLLRRRLHADIARVLADKTLTLA